MDYQLDYEDDEAWFCTECATAIPGSKDFCPHCVPRAKICRRGGDWECHECNSTNAAYREVCIKCGWRGHRASHADVGFPEASALPEAKDTTRMTTAFGGAILALATLSPKFEASWISYCKCYGVGISDPSKFDESFISEFVEYAAELISTDMEQQGADKPQMQATAEDRPPAARDLAGALQAHPAVVEPSKRPAAWDPASIRPAKIARSLNLAPLGLQKRPVACLVPLKGAVVDEIHRLNATGGLLAAIRPGAVAALLGQVSIDVALEILAVLDERRSTVEDPDLFIRDQAKAYILAACTALGKVTTMFI